MSFKSYAQNFEDIMLWRALKHIEKGFYLDIGAQDPVVDSVSLGFYEQGWRGIHFEPTNFYSKKLRSARPDEEVYQIAISDSSSDLVLYEFASTGLSTGSKSIAEGYIEAGRPYVETVIPSITLDQALEYVKGRDIHWLKLDVEGMESKVLSSWIESSVRPWILVIESTKPGTQIECYDEWEPSVLQKGYEFVYFDGLNRYYLSDKHRELKIHFLYPVNIFDDFVLSGLSSRAFFSETYNELKSLNIEITEKLSKSETWAMDLNERLIASEAKVIDLNERLIASEAKVIVLNERLIFSEQSNIALKKSFSWKITQPIRSVKNKLLKSSELYSIYKTKFKEFIKVFLYKVKIFVVNHPRLIRLSTIVFERFPMVKNKLKIIMSHSKPEEPITVELSEHGVGIYNIIMARAYLKGDK